METESSKPLIDRNSTRPLQVQIQDYILSLIMGGELNAGDNLLSEHEMALKLGVSRLTVRKAYSELVKKGTLYTVHGKGTFVVDSLVKESINRADRETRPANRMIGILFPEITQYFGPIMREIESFVTQDGYTLSVMFNDSLERERYAIEQMIAQNLAGLILTPRWQKRMSSVSENYETLTRSGLPFVMIGEPPFHVLCDSVYVDEAYAIYDTVEVLIGMGHQEFVYLYDSVGSESHALMARNEGFRLASRILLEAKKPEMIDVFHKDWKEQFSNLILSSYPITAVITTDDRTATSAYNVIYECGKTIPNDVSVVGYNNTYICEILQVKLSSVAHNSKLLGRYAYDLLKARIKHNEIDPTVTHRVVLKPELILRDSVGQRSSS